ncbi:hypothetical protein Slin14017_G063670 [Septoria linicola]|nr:hypothetical protein Slin14017_G063670 [Septoria linicola]
MADSTTLDSDDNDLIDLDAAAQQMSTQPQDIILPDEETADEAEDVVVVRAPLSP